MRMIFMDAPPQTTVRTPVRAASQLGLASRVAKGSMGRQAIAASGRALALAAFAALAAACGQPPPGGEPIDREVFIEAYVDLRVAALDSDEFVVSPEQRDEILAHHGVDQERLLHFAEVHGGDVDFMNEVWSEVDRRLQERSADDSAA
jgi:hypothetical protein